MIITCNGQNVSMPEGASALDCLKAAGLPLKGVLAASGGGRVYELNEPVRQDTALWPQTLQQEEGRRIYERSIRFVMLLAVRRLWPGYRVRVEYSVGSGVFVRLPDKQLSAEDLQALEAEMRTLTSADLAFTKRRWRLADAIRYFEEDGQADKVALLRLRPYDYFNMYCLDGMWEYFYGAMVPSTGYVPLFALTPWNGGFVLRYPSAASPEAVPPYVDRPKHLRVFAESARWCGILGVENTADIAAMTREGHMRDFIRVNEALHDKAIARIADEIHDGGKRVVLIAGPSSSGKTTFARRLVIHLRVLGMHPLLVSLDNYYLNRTQVPLQPNGEADLESIHALDLPLIQEQVNRLLEGETVLIPRYSFRNGSRETEGIPAVLGDGEPIILEGIHALNPLMREDLPQAQVYRIFVSALTCLNLDDHNRIRTTDVRLLRRMVRDWQFRGTTPEGTLSMWDSVRDGERTWIFPWQEESDAMFNTALHYELPFLKATIGDALERIPADHPHRLKAQRILKTLHYIPEAPRELWNEIPPTSILREFIGGLTFDQEA